MISIIVDSTKCCGNTERENEAILYRRKDVFASSYQVSSSLDRQYLARGKEYVQRHMSEKPGMLSQ